MKSLILAALILSISVSFAFADSGAECNQTNDDGVRMVREAK